MNSKLKTIVFGSLIIGSLILSAVPVMARDGRFNDRDRSEQSDNQRWGNYPRRGADYQEWQQARQQALYAASHHASRKKIAELDARADEILNRMRHRH